jgi:hypothetical protein
MIHRFDNGELWGSFFVSDQIAASLANNEAVFMQLDAMQPIELQGKNACGGAAKQPRQFDFQYTQTEVHNDEPWQFNAVVERTSIQDLLAPEQRSYKTLVVDRRYEVVDFPIAASIGLPELFNQFQQANKLQFRYFSEANEQRKAEFDISNEANATLDRLLNR